VVASHLLVPRYGLEGAAWAVLAASATQALCLGAVYLSVCLTGSELAAPAAGARAELRTVT